MGVDGVQHEGLEADAASDRRRRRQRRRHQEAEVQNRDRRSLLLVKTPTFKHRHRTKRIFFESLPSLNSIRVLTAKHILR